MFRLLLRSGDSWVAEIIDTTARRPPLLEGKMADMGRELLSLFWGGDVEETAAPELPEPPVTPTYSEPYSVVEAPSTVLSSTGEAGGSLASTVNSAEPRLDALEVGWSWPKASPARGFVRGGWPTPPRSPRGEAAGPPGLAEAPSAGAPLPQGSTGPLAWADAPAAASPASDGRADLSPDSASEPRAPEASRPGMTANLPKAAPRPSPQTESGKRSGPTAGQRARVSRPLSPRSTAGKPAAAAAASDLWTPQGDASAEAPAPATKEALPDRRRKAALRTAR